MPFLAPDARPAQGHAQLVATLGPSSFELAAEMASAGATAFRLNASHLRPAALAAALEGIRHACRDAPVVVDLQGAKMRLGWIAPREVSAGERVRLSRDGHHGTLLPHPELYRQAAAGDVVSVDDGSLRLRVVEVETSWLEAEALTAGRLAPRKGVNVERHPVRLATLAETDLEAIAVAAGFGVQAYAFSFMENGEEAAWVRARAPGALVVGKVEREEAVGALESIASRTDAVWICRGDLGAQLGAARLARAVAAVDPRACPAPVLMAGQVLQSLVDHDGPTRSEVCHLHDLLARGYAGIVLSDETAVGGRPVAAARTAAELLAALTPPAPAAPRWT